MQRLLKWALMLSKRLYKKVAFLAIMLAIPAFALALSFAAKQDSGFVKVVLTKEDANDVVATKIVDELLQDNTLINFSAVESPADAVGMVKSGQADAVWIFPGGIEEKINTYSGIDSNKKPFIKVIEREKTVFSQISREKLTAIMFGYCARACYIDYARTNISALDGLTDEQLLYYYDNVAITEELFTFNNINNSIDNDDVDYLTAPIRGILAVLVALCGMAAAMFYIDDEKRGTFSLVQENRKLLVSSACILIAVFNIAIVVLLALFVSSLATSFLNELLCMILYCICCTAFCLLLMELFPSVKLYSAVVPLFVVLMVALCPVFFDFSETMAFGRLFPPAYYIYAIYSTGYKLYMLGYTVVVIALTVLIKLVKKYVSLYIKIKR